MVLSCIIISRLSSFISISSVRKQQKLNKCVHSCPQYIKYISIVITVHSEWRNNARRKYLAIPDGKWSLYCIFVGESELKTEKWLLCEWQKFDPSPSRVSSAGTTFTYWAAGNAQGIVCWLVNASARITASVRSQVMEPWRVSQWICISTCRGRLRILALWPGERAISKWIVNTQAYRVLAPSV